MQSPFEFFFSLGDKVTKGNPKRKADFDYYMLWIMFIAFVTVFIGYFHSFVLTLELSKLGWALVILCVLWFQYFTLKASREARKYIKSIPEVNPKQDERIEDVDDMIKGFDKKEDKKDGQRHRRTRKQD